MNSQDVANTLWAYVTMGRETREGLMRELEGRAEAVAGTLNAQDVSNMLCQHEYFLVFAPLWKEVDGRIP